MRELYTDLSTRCSRLTTHLYSTSFSLSSRLLEPGTREAIYRIYGFVRLADEIVDSFQGYDQASLLREFRQETARAIERGISLNPILHSFQITVQDYHIELSLIDAFFESMEADLAAKTHDRTSFDRYVYGSAEAVGLMCLRVFVRGDETLYASQKDAARSLGAAFQKVNFLRDLRDDSVRLERCYFPQLSPKGLTLEKKREIEAEIEADFNRALPGIRALPKGAKTGVYLAYIYFRTLLEKLKRLPPETIVKSRVRLRSFEKAALMLNSLVRCRTGDI